jgi:cytochrome P450
MLEKEIKESFKSDKDDKSKKNNWIEKFHYSFLWLIGHPYPGIPHLRGNLFYGRTPYLEEENGIFNNLLAIKPLLETHPSRMCSFWLGNKKVLVITHPEDVYNFKIKHASDIGSEINTLDSMLGGSSLVTTSGELWKGKRNIYRHHLNISNLRNGIENLVESFITNITKTLNINSEVNLKNLFDDICLRANLNLLMGFQLDSEHFEEIVSYKRDISGLMTAGNLFSLPAKEKVTNNFQEKFKKVFEYIKEPNTLISDLISLSHSNDTFSDISSEFNLLTVAGSETNSFALQAAIYFLCCNSHLEKKFYKEISEKVRDFNGDLSSVCLEKGTYLDQIVKEVLRIYPPAPFILPRAVENNFSIGGVDVEKGDMVLVSPYLTHRLTDFWENPEEFKPERFASDTEVCRGAYIPFGLGSRMCPGEEYAMFLVKSLLAVIYLKYNVKSVKEPTELTFQNSSAFFFKEPQVVRFTLRDAEINQNVTVSHSKNN